MRLSLTTWNINSVRLRIDLVAKFLKSARPEMLCLQETKCIDDAFPLKRFKRLGYEHVALNGQKGYHGVAIVSKIPFESKDIRTFCDKMDSRHISVSFGERAGIAKPLVLHNFYVPAGGDIPDPALNAPRVTSNSSGCGQSNSSTREAGQGTVSLSLFPGQELQRLL